MTNGMFKALDKLEAEITRRFWMCVTKEFDETKCWFWTGKILYNGYGSFSIGKSNCMAHRVAWELTHGRIPYDRVIAHHCDVRNCVRPSHLFVATQKENIADMLNKGRWTVTNRARGERAGRAVLTELQAKEILYRVVTTKITAPELVLEYGITYAAMHALLSGKSWQHLHTLLENPVPDTWHARGRRIVTVEIAREVKRLGVTGMRKTDIARQVGIGPRAVYHILDGSAWGHVV